MAVTALSTDMRNEMLDILLDEFDTGSTNAQGRIEIRSSGGTLLATILMGNPAFDSAGSAGGNADGVGAAETMTADSSADNNGTAAVAHFLDRDENILFKGVVGTSGQEVNLNTTSITAGQNVALSAGTITMPDA